MFFYNDSSKSGYCYSDGYSYQVGENVTQDDCYIYECDLIYGSLYDWVYTGDMDRNCHLTTPPSEFDKNF